MAQKNNLIIRLIMYFGGLLIMTAGIAVSVKSNLGVSPVSSIPYTLTCVWGIEMGKATILLHFCLVLLQLLLLRGNFEAKSFLQIAVGFVFGFFTTFCNWCMSFLPSTDNMLIRVIMMLVSAVLIAFGIFLYLPADIIPLAGEGTVSVISHVTQKPFPKVKVAFDVSMVAVSLLVCLLFIHSPGSVGIGTVAAALLVGVFLDVITKLFGARRDKILSKR